MSDRFNPRLRDADGKHIAAPIRGTAQRQDFRGDAPPPDPNAFALQSMQRAQAAADRRSAAIERDRAGQLSPDRRIASLEAELIELKVRLANLEAAIKPPAKVGRISKPTGGGDGPLAA